MKTLRHFLLTALAVMSLPVAHAADSAVTEQKSIPFDQLGAEAQKQYAGEGISITPTATGARLRAVMQDLEAEATLDGLWLTSTDDEDAGKPNRFRVRAMKVGRGEPTGISHHSTALSPTGVVRATKEAVAFVRPGLVEEYTVSTDGVRQDFVVLERPAGHSGALNLLLEVTGARAESAAYGARLTVTATGRELAYSRLKVTDATGRELTAHMTADATDRLRVVVEDAGAVYPVRIDPTFSDADWVSLNPGMPGTNGTVYAAVVDSSGNLFVGGYFTFIGTVAANRVAKWNGSAWSALGTGVSGTVLALAVSGSDLYAGGNFTTAGGVANTTRIAKWDGSAWSALGTGMDGGTYPSVNALAVSGSDLYAGGGFTTAGGTTVNRIAKWNGSAWSALGTGMDFTVNALAVSGSELYAGGYFTTAGGTTAVCIAKWNGSAWSALGTGMDNAVYALAVSGSDLYAGGFFTAAGGTTVNRIAKWNGSAWSALGTGMDYTVNALAVSGSDLYAGGNFTTAGGTTAIGIAKWNGSAWSALGTGMNGDFRALAVSGSDLYAGGRFTTAGGTTVNRIAKWNGSAWSALGSGMDWDVQALVVSGSNLYAGGEFSTAGGTTANFIAKWNGSAWSALGTGMNSYVRALAVSGSDLYAGGNFSTAGGTSANSIAKWNGSVWSALGTGMNSGSYVRALAVSGSDLYAGGDFSTAGGVNIGYGIAKWNGSAWSALGTGMNTTVYALAADSTGHLYLGGGFYFAGTTVSPFIAQANLNGPPPTVASIAPASGTTLGSTSVTITGTNFVAPATVTIGGTAATSVVVSNATTITAVTPAHAAGAVSVLVTTPGGTNAANTLFTYLAPPTISDVTAQTINEDNATSALAITVGDTETAAASLTLSKSSSNTTLVPTANIVFGGSGSARTVTVTPSAHQFGIATITLTVTDGDGMTASDTFILTVTAVADTPSITNATTNEDTQSTSGLVITRNAADSTEVSHFKITGITNGTLFQNNGTTAIAINAFITFAQANAGLKFSPTANFNGNGSFTVQASTSAADVGLGGSTVSATIMVNAVNDVPVFTKGANQTHPFGTTAAQSFTGWATGIDDGDAGVTQALSFNVSNNLNGLFSVQPSVSGTGTLSYTPNGTAGTATVSVSLTDDATAGGAALTSAVQTFTITVSANIAPTISDVTDKTISEDSNTGALAITVGDTETAAASLTMSGSSSNTTLVPNANIVFSGSGANRTVTVTPAANQYGSATITLNVNDGTTTASDTFILTVTGVADTPSITNATTNEDTQSTSGLVITRNAADSTEVTHFKINAITNGTLFQNNGTTAIASNAFITFAQGNAGLKFSPTANFIGNGSFTVQASTSAADVGLGGGTATATITVNAVNDVPAFTKGANQTHPFGTTAAQSFTGWATGIDDGDDGVTQALSFNVSNNLNGLFSVQPSVSSAGVLAYTPNGTATVSVSLTDDATAGGAALTTVVQTFTITVSANMAPTISDVVNQTIIRGSATSALAITVGDTETAAASLIMSGSSSNTTLVPYANIVFGGSGANRTVTVTPAANQYGSATITLTVTDDGGSTASDTFVLTVEPFPEISLAGNGVVIAHNDTTPSSADHTDFGSANVINTLVTRTFTLANTGDAALGLTGTPLVELSGANAGDFQVTVDPESSVEPAESTTFAITFDPALPGLRTATITIASDDPAKPAYTFAISGYGGLSTLLAQTITFAPPATVYLGQSPLALNASASSGLPVTLSLVAPIPAGATLTGNVLTFTTAGTVKVQATQLGSGNYKAALAVTKTITVKADPTVLTLINLNQTYDGTPKPVSSIPAADSITYKVGTTYVLDAPTAAGSYPVKAVLGIKTVTGTLVIAKAPLYVTPDDQRKFAGQPNPTLPLPVITGFQNGETAAVLTKAPVLKTTATTASAGGLYPITASGASALNYSFIYRQGTLVVESFAGTYEALLVDGTPLPVGKLSLTVAATSKTFTGKLYTPTETAALSLLSTSLTTNPSTELATGTVTVTKAGIPYVVEITLPLHGDVLATVTRSALPLGTADDGRKLSTQTVLYAGAHTAVLEPATPMGATVPIGAGWATASISTTGIMTLTGKLGDDTVFTSALTPDVDSTPGYRLFVQPYKTGTVTRTESYLAGALSLPTHPTLTNRRYLEQATLTWKKTGLGTDALYRTTFGPVSTLMMIDPWLPPAAAKGSTPAVTLAQRLGLSSVPLGFGVSHSTTGNLTHDGNLPNRVALSSTNLVSVTTPLANVTKWKTLTFVASIGTFTGSFELADIPKRTVSFNGVLRQPATALDPLIGDGHYLLPPLVGTEKTTGEVMFTRP